MTLRKFIGLSHTTQLRKLLLWTRLAAESALKGDKSPIEEDFLLAAIQTVAELQRISIFESANTQNAPRNPRFYLTLHHALRQLLGLGTADWDLVSPPDGTHSVQRIPCSVFLEDLRSPFNLGSIIRTSEALGFSSVLLGPGCPSLDHPRVVKTAMGTQSHLRVEVQTLEEAVMEAQGRVFAIELGGTSLEKFTFPTEGLALLGSEELGLSPQALEIADRCLGRVSVPLFGHKSSLNVGVAWGIVSQHWGEICRESV